MMGKLIFVFAVSVLLANAAAAGCAAEAYSKACTSCKFDANGTMDKSCYQAYQSSGTACTSRTYPIMSAAYAAGKCPAVDACADQLRACKSAGSGNDELDCESSLMSQCFKDADSCVRDAAKGCGEKLPSCPTGFVLAGLALFVFARSRVE